MSEEPKKRFVFKSEEERQDYHDKGSNMAERLGKMLKLPLIVYENKGLLIVAGALGVGANYQGLSDILKSILRFLP